MNINTKWRLLTVTSVAVAGLSACGGNNGSTVPPVTPTPQSIDFQIFASQAFSNSANSSPVSLNLTFNFDANDDPTAFDSLIASGTFGGS
jgi:hypothetical protein